MGLLRSLLSRLKRNGRSCSWNPCTSSNHCRILFFSFLTAVDAAQLDPYFSQAVIFFNQLPMLWFLLAVLLVSTSAHPQHGSGLGDWPAHRWSARQFRSLITFGDSYTDENRLNYFLLHNGSAPPSGTFLPEVSLVERRRA